MTSAHANPDLSILSVGLPEPVRRSLFRSGVRWVSQVDGLSDTLLALKSGIDPQPTADLREQLRAAVGRLRRDGGDPLAEPSLQVPPAEASTPIAVLGLSRRPSNVLKTYRCKTLADLHGLTGSALLSMRNLGRKSLGEIVDALSQYTSVGGARSLAKAFPPKVSAGSDRDKTLGTIDLSGLSFPGISRRWEPDSTCDLRKSLALFRLLNVNTVDELLDKAESCAVILGTRRQIEAARNLRTVSERLRMALEAGAFQSVDDEPQLPERALVANQAAVATSRSVSGEISAVFLRVVEKNRMAVRQRWTSTSGRFPTLEEVGRQRGITRERTRQIVTRAERDLLESHIWLPRTARLLGDFALQREKWTIAQMQNAFADRGEVVSESDVRLLPTLALLGALPDCTCDRDDMIRLASPAEVARKERKESEALAAGVTSALFSLERNGWLAEADGWDPDSAMAQLLSRRLRPRPKEFVVLGGAVIPNPGTLCSLSRWVARRLNVAGAMTLDALFQRMAVFTESSYGHRLKLCLPSQPVFEALLACNPRFDVADGLVELHATPEDGDPLTPAERSLIEGVRAVGGSIDYRRLVTLAEEKGLSVASVALLTQGPLLDRVRKAHYILPTGKGNGAE